MNTHVSRARKIRTAVEIDEQALDRMLALINPTTDSRFVIEFEDNTTLTVDGTVLPVESFTHAIKELRFSSRGDPSVEVTFSNEFPTYTLKYSISGDSDATRVVASKIEDFRRSVRTNYWWFYEFLGLVLIAALISFSSLLLAMTFLDVKDSSIVDPATALRVLFVGVVIGLIMGAVGFGLSGYVIKRIMPQASIAIGAEGLRRRSAGAWWRSVIFIGIVLATGTSVLGSIIYARLP